MPMRSTILIVLGGILVLLSLGTRLVIFGAESQAEVVGAETLSRILHLESDAREQRGDPRYPSVSPEGKSLGDVNVSLQSRDPKRLLVLSEPFLMQVVFDGAVVGRIERTPAIVNFDTGTYTLSSTYRTGQYEASFLSSNVAQVPLRTPYQVLSYLWLPGLLCLGLGWKFVAGVTSSGEAPAQRPSTVRDRSSSLDTVMRSAPPIPPDGLFEHDPSTPEANRFGRFVKGDRVGKGAMGEVFRCTSCLPGDNNIYALKVLLPEWSTAEDFRTRFEREADVCRKFAHPNLVRAYDHGEKDGRLWLVMDFVDGMELEEWLQSGDKRTETALKRMFLSIFQGLEYAHRVGVVHRDLKPGNIMVRRDTDEPVIADFGLAKGKHYATITKTNTTLGTPTYIAPEQITGGKGSAQSDLYSMGCVMYEALTGHPPFEEKDVMKLLTLKLLEETPPEMPEDAASPEMRAIVTRLLSHSVEERYQTAGEVIEALKR